MWLFTKLLILERVYRIKWNMSYQANFIIYFELNGESITIIDQNDFTGESIVLPFEYILRLAIEFTEEFIKKHKDEMYNKSEEEITKTISIEKRSFKLKYFYET